MQAVHAASRHDCTPTGTVPASFAVIQWPSSVQSECKFSDSETTCDMFHLTRQSLVVSLTLHSLGHVHVYPRCVKPPRRSDYPLHLCVGPLYVAVRVHLGCNAGRRERRRLSSTVHCLCKFAESAMDAHESIRETSCTAEQQYLFRERQIQNGSEELCVELRFVLLHCRLVCLADWQVTNCAIRGTAKQAVSRNADNG